MLHKYMNRITSRGGVKVPKICAKTNKSSWRCVGWRWVTFISIAWVFTDSFRVRVFVSIFYMQIFREASPCMSACGCVCAYNNSCVLLILMSIYIFVTIFIIQALSNLLLLAASLKCFFFIYKTIISDKSVLIMSH